MIGADMYVWDSWKLVIEDDDASAQSRKSHVHVSTVWFDWVAIVVFVQCDICRAKSGKLVSDSGTRSILNAEKLFLAEVYTTCKIRNLNNVHHMKNDTAISRNSVTDENITKSVPVCNFSCKKYEAGEIVANFDQITKLP